MASAYRAGSVNMEIMGQPGTDINSRDSLVNRLQGICSKTVEPAITPVVRFAFRDGKTIMAILVRRGSQPIYYSSHTPYMRHLTEAGRPRPLKSSMRCVLGWSRERTNQMRMPFTGAKSIPM